MGKEFYDLVYEAWRTGRNPDCVSKDDYDMRISEGYRPDEITLSDVLPHANIKEEEESSNER